MGERYKFFQHRDCEYFPCHSIKDRNSFNCLFCYCPLYALGRGCGGNFTYTEKGIKDCSNCLIPHSSGGYEYILEHFQQVVDLIKEGEEE